MPYSIAIRYDPVDSRGFDPLEPPPETAIERLLYRGPGIFEERVVKNNDPHRIKIARRRRVEAM